ncbi:MAG TPA: DUF5723 family protein, partial [Bacteroidia bacterium]|nr:DUF5723 family protein [Bacteroidia bacterium]
MKKLLPFILWAFSFCSFAQQEFSSFCNTGHGGATTFATDYQAVGINPANLGWAWKFSDKKVALGFSEFTGSIYSEALKKDELRNMVSGIVSGNGQNFTYDQKVQAASNFAQSGFTMNMDLGSVGVAVTTKKAGGFGFRVNDHFQFTSTLGASAADLIFLGKTSSVFDMLTIQLSNGSTQNIANHPNLSPDTAKMVINGYTNAPKLLSKILDGTDITMMYTRDYNLSYGRKIFGDSVFALSGGVGIKYVQGISLLNIKSEGGVLTGYSSMSPAFGINYGNAAAQANQVSGAGFPPKAVGSGFGFDFGVNAIIKNKLKIGAALINVGSVTWSGNVYSIKDTLVFSTKNAGLQNYNIVSQLKNMFGDSGGIFRVTGQKSITTQLPGMMRAGASIMLGKMAEVGIDCIIPTNNTIPGTIKNPIIGMGGDFMPLPWLKLQGGFITGGNYKYQIPVGIMFIA